MCTSNGLAFDTDGNLYIADGTNPAIRKISPDGKVSTFTGTGTYGYKDGPASQAQFGSPYEIAFDKAGNLFVTDGKNQCIRKITRDGNVSTLAGKPFGYPVSDTASLYADGQGTAARFVSPLCIAIDKDNNLYVGDQGSNSRMFVATIRKITPTGKVSTLTGYVGSKELNNFGMNPNALADARSLVFYQKGDL